MSELDEAMSEHIADVVLSEQRACSYGRDFARFSAHDKEYTMTHGTFRNKISKLIAKGEVEVNHRSIWTFYTLKGHRFGKPMTHNHVGGPSRKSNSMYELINNLPLGKNSLHDIRLSFKVPQIWTILSAKFAFKINPKNKDIRLPGINVDDKFIGVKIHRTDTVSVAVACSYFPIAVDIGGVIRLSSALTRAEERLANYIAEAGVKVSSDSTLLPIPYYMKWIVKMWHFGADGLVEYGGKKFEITYADAAGILTRIYSKHMKDGKIRLRSEIQEYPNKQLDRAIEDKLNANYSSFDLSGLTGSNRVGTRPLCSQYTLRKKHPQKPNWRVI